MNSTNTLLLGIFSDSLKRICLGDCTPITVSRACPSQLPGQNSISLNMTHIYAESQNFDDSSCHLVA